MLKPALDIAKTGKNFYKMGKELHGGITDKASKENEYAMYWSAEWNGNLIQIKSTHEIVSLYINEVNTSYLLISTLREKKCQSCRMIATLPTGEDLKIIIEYKLIKMYCHLYIDGNLIEKGKLCINKKTNKCVTYGEQNNIYKYDNLPCSISCEQENQQSQIAMGHDII